VSVDAPTRSAADLHDDLLTRLRDEIETESDGHAVGHENLVMDLTADIEDRMLSPSVRASVAALVDGFGFELRSDALDRGLSAVERALESRQLWTGTLQAWLRELRIEQHLSLDEVAQAGGLVPDDLFALESSGKHIASLGADSIVAWIRALGAPLATALRALELSLDVSVSAQTYGAFPDAESRRQANALLDEVRGKLLEL
jgi:transcriptional regulator with XRE-family HTH domain